MAQVATAAGRAAAARVIMDDPGFASRWTEFLMDEMRVSRAGYKVQEGCFGTALRGTVSAELATFLRDHGPAETAPGGAFNMKDVLQSSLALDDLSPFYRAQLFAMLSRPNSGCNNLTEVQNDLFRRRGLAEQFQSTYLHRNVDCAACHNSEGSPTATADPKTNRFWPLPGLYGKALWGASTGRDAEQTQAPFRYHGVAAREPDDPPSPLTAAEVVPWGMDASCGVLIPPSAIAPDPAGVDGYLGQALGQTASIWDLERQFGAGFTALRGKSLPPGDVDGPRAFAALLSETLADDAWTELLGTPLTVPHYFPRSEAQRDVLGCLAGAVSQSGWSLRALLTAIVTHPLFNLAAPGDTRADDSIAPVFDPFSVDSTAAADQSNSADDHVHRAGARVLFRSVSQALEWPEAPAFPSATEAAYQEALGAPLDDDRTGDSSADFQGLLLWESRLGACIAPTAAAVHDPPSQVPPAACAGRCGASPDYGNHGCSCDDACTTLGDCCSDFATACPPQTNVTADWIDKLGAAADAWSLVHPDDPLRVRDVVLAEKDRLLTEPRLDADEEVLTAALFGATTLDDPLPPATTWLPHARLYCGLLLKTPQFLMRGVPGRISGTPARLIALGGSVHELCDAMSTAIRAETAREPTCTDTGLTLAPQ